MTLEAIFISITEEFGRFFEYDTFETFQINIGSWENFLCFSK